MTGVRALLDKATAEMGIVVLHSHDPVRLALSNRIVDGCRDAADRLDVELAQLRNRRANDERMALESEDWNALRDIVVKLFNPSMTTHHGLNPEGAELGILEVVLEQVARRLDAIPCTCRPATEADGGSKWRVAHPDWEWHPGPCDVARGCCDEDIIVCTRCAALGRVMDQRAPGVE